MEQKDNKELYKDIINILSNDGAAIKYIKDPTEEMQLEAVKEEPFAILYIKEPSEEVQLEAVKREYLAIDFIKNPTEKVQEFVREKESGI